MSNESTEPLMSIFYLCFHWVLIYVCILKKCVLVSWFVEECRCSGECRIDAPLFTVWNSSIIYGVSTPLCH